MGLLDSIRGLFQKKQEAPVQTTQIKKLEVKSWYQDNYEKVRTQRDLFLVIACISIIATGIAANFIHSLESTRKVEPFVIEIEKKTGIPTVVDPVSIAEYSSNESIRRYFITQYIKAREEYFGDTFQRMYSLVTRVLSTPAVYYSDYRPKYSPSNPNSPVNIFGQNVTRTVSWKSLIFQTNNTAQVRFVLETTTGTKTNKIALVEFAFQNLQMSEEERLINPLGFVVTQYRIENDSIQ